MKMEIPISFLMAAHNEEKIINKTLEGLKKLPYSNYEVILGLDGCTDNTEKIVKNYTQGSKNFKYYSLNLRKGKPEVIDYLIQKAKGEIIVIIDADWIFKVKNKYLLNNFFNLFNDKTIGGIAESFPIDYPLTKKSTLLQTGVSIQNKIWIDHSKSQGIKYGDWIVADKNKFPLLVNIFRKELYKKNQSLGDDFERFFDITESGKKVLATTNINFPRMISSVKENYTLRGLFIQKKRTAIARNQLKKKIKNKLGIDFLFFILKEIKKLSFKEFFGFFLVSIIFIFSTIIAKFKKDISLSEGWKMRIKR